MRTKNKPPTHPGEILKEHYLVPLGVTNSALAETLGVSREKVSKIVNRRGKVDAEMALRLSRAFCTTPDLWLNLQRNYDLWHVERASKTWRRVKPVPGASERGGKIEAPRNEECARNRSRKLEEEPLRTGLSLVIQHRVHVLPSPASRRKEFSENDAREILKKIMPPGIPTDRLEKFSEMLTYDVEIYRVQRDNERFFGKEGVRLRTRAFKKAHSQAAWLNAWWVGLDRYTLMDFLGHSEEEDLDLTRALGLLVERLGEAVKSTSNPGRGRTKGWATREFIKSLYHICILAGINPTAFRDPYRENEPAGHLFEFVKEVYGAMGEPGKDHTIYDWIEDVREATKPKRKDTT